MRKLRYVGTLDRDDLRPVVGKDQEKFVFHSRTSKVDRKAGELQYAEGVEMADADALELLTHPVYGVRFLDITDLDPADAAAQPAGAPEPAFAPAPLIATATGFPEPEAETKASKPRAAHKADAEG